MNRIYNYDKFKGQFLKQEKDMEMFEKLILSIILNYEHDKLCKEMDELEFNNLTLQDFAKAALKINSLAKMYGL